MRNSEFGIRKADSASVFHSAFHIPHSAFEKLRGLESNQRPPGSGPGVATSSYRPGVTVQGEGVEPSLPGSKPGGLPVSRSPNEIPLGCASRLTEQRKEWELNPQGLFGSPAFEAGAIAS